MNKEYLDLDGRFPNFYHQKTLKVVRNSTCNFRIIDCTTIDIWAYLGGLYKNFVSFAVQKMFNNHVLSFVPG